MSHKTRADLEGVETSPDGRYIRFDEKLGSGAYKSVWLAYDTDLGIEVAWNTVDLKRLPEREKSRLKSETDILKNLKHYCIINFYNSWENPELEQVVFTTEIVTSGTLKQYVSRFKPIKLKVIKKWCRQILQGLCYLHSKNPPIIHRDLKCDNIFINGSTGDIRIGDLGLSTLRSATHVASVLGTPEFMAPELYDEWYTEKVDVYAFGMVVLEMISNEYPYAECTNTAQIYKKVSAGIRPDSLNRLHGRSTKAFIELCLAPSSVRLAAEDLAMHPFLDPRFGHYRERFAILYDPICGASPSTPLVPVMELAAVAEHSHVTQASEEMEINEVSSLNVILENTADNIARVVLRLDLGTRRKEIKFPFDLESDTAEAVAVEMVKELGLQKTSISKLAEAIFASIKEEKAKWQQVKLLAQSRTGAAATPTDALIPSGSPPGIGTAGAAAAPAPPLKQPQPTPKPPPQQPPQLHHGVATAPAQAASVDPFTLTSLPSDPLISTQNGSFLPTASSSLTTPPPDPPFPSSAPLFPPSAPTAAFPSPFNGSPSSPGPSSVDLGDGYTIPVTAPSSFTNQPPLPFPQQDLPAAKPSKFPTAAASAVPFVAQPPSSFQSSVSVQASLNPYSPFATTTTTTTTSDASASVYALSQPQSSAVTQAATRPASQPTLPSTAQPSESSSIIPSSSIPIVSSTAIPSGAQAMPTPIPPSGAQSMPTPASNQAAASMQSLPSAAPAVPSGVSSPPPSAPRMVKRRSIDDGRGPETNSQDVDSFPSATVPADNGTSKSGKASPEQSLDLTNFLAGFDVSVLGGNQLAVLRGLRSQLDDSIRTLKVQYATMYREAVNKYKTEVADSLTGWGFTVPPLSLKTQGPGRTQQQRSKQPSNLSRRTIDVISMAQGSFQDLQSLDPSPASTAPNPNQTSTTKPVVNADHIYNRLIQPFAPGYIVANNTLDLEPNKDQQQQPPPKELPIEALPKQQLPPPPPPAAGSNNWQSDLDSIDPLVWDRPSQQS